MQLLTERHQRFYSPGWARFARGEQGDQADRYVADVDGALTADPSRAFVVDADARPDLYSELALRFEREFFSTALQRWV